MIIEFTGIAGSGKSYIGKKIYDGLFKKGIRVRRDSDISKVKYLYPNNIILFLMSFYFVYKSKSKTFLDFIKVSFVWYKLQVRMKYSLREKGIVLIDEGYIHKFRLVRRKSKFIDLFLSKIYMKNFYVSDYLIIVDANFETIIKRIKTRDNKVILLDEESLKNGKKRTDKDAQYLEKKEQMKIINFNNINNKELDGNIAESIEIILKDFSYD